MTVYAQNLETSGVREQYPDGQRVQLSWSPKHTFVIGGRADRAPGEESNRMFDRIAGARTHSSRQLLVAVSCRWLWHLSPIAARPAARPLR